MQIAIEKNIFLLISCSAKNMKKIFNFEKEIVINDIRFPLLSNKKNDFLNEIASKNESSWYTVNDGNDAIYVIPSLLFDNDDNNNDNCMIDENRNNSNILQSGNYGIEIQFVSICLSPPFRNNQNDNQLENENENGSVNVNSNEYDIDENEINYDNGRRQSNVRTGTNTVCTVRTIETQLELLMLPTAKTDR